MENKNWIDQCLQIESLRILGGNWENKGIENPARAQCINASSKSKAYLPLCNGKSTKKWPKCVLLCRQGCCQFATSQQTMRGGLTSRRVEEHHALIGILTFSCRWCPPGGVATTWSSCRQLCSAISKGGTKGQVCDLCVFVYGP